MGEAIFTGLTYGLIAAASVAGFFLTIAAFWLCIDFTTMIFNMIMHRGIDEHGRGKPD